MIDLPMPDDLPSILLLDLFDRESARENHIPGRVGVGEENFLHGAQFVLLLDSLPNDARIVVHTHRGEDLDVVGLS